MRHIVFYEFFTIFFTSFFRKKLVKTDLVFLARARREKKDCFFFTKPLDFRCKKSEYAFALRERER